MLAVRGPRGTGLTKAQIIATFERRLENHPDFEFAEALRNVHRVAELRLDDRFGVRPLLGEQAWDCAELLARHSDPGFAENGQLTVTYLTDAHRAAAAQLVRWMRECGFDSVKVDAVGNVVGVYRAAMPDAKTLADRVALRHGEKRRALRRPPRHLRADDRRARAEPGRPASCRSRSSSSRSPRRKASATRRPSSARARSSASSIESGSTRSTPTACRCATRCATPGCRRARARSRSSSASPPTTSASSRSTSSRGRC
jgi:hypothetical protein